MASSAILVLAGCMLAKYLTSLSSSIWSAMIVCSTASWWELAEFRKYSARENAEVLEERRAADTSRQTSACSPQGSKSRRQTVHTYGQTAMSEQACSSAPTHPYIHLQNKHHSVFLIRVSLTALVKVQDFYGPSIKEEQIPWPTRGKQHTH